MPKWMSDNFDHSCKASWVVTFTHLSDLRVNLLYHSHRWVLFLENSTYENSAQMSLSFGADFVANDSTFR